MRIRNNKVNVFLSDDEKFILKRDSSKLNLSQSEYIRNLIVGYKVKNSKIKEEIKTNIDKYIIEKILKNTRRKYQLFNQSKKQISLSRLF